MVAQSRFVGGLDADFLDVWEVVVGDLAALAPFALARSVKCQHVVALAVVRQAALCRAVLQDQAVARRFAMVVAATAARTAVGRLVPTAVAIPAIMRQVAERLQE